MPIIRVFDVVFGINVDYAIAIKQYQFDRSERGFGSHPFNITAGSHGQIGKDAELTVDRGAERRFGLDHRYTDTNGTAGGCAVADTKKRCSWCLADEDYIAYHDDEWGVPITAPAPLFKLLMLEGMQAGLSWLTILRKRAAMEDAFFGFDAERLAASGAEEVGAWLENPNIIRHRGKLEALIRNARAMLAIDDFEGFIWQFQPAETTARKSLGDVPAQTAESAAMSKALKQEGFNFVGPTICYAFMQSAGLVNDHISDCWRYERCAELQNER